MISTNNPITLISISLACIALLLAVGPPYYIDKKINALSPKYSEPERTYTIEIKGVKLGIGKREKVESKTDNTTKIKKLEKDKEIIFIVMIIVSVLAIFSGLFSYFREPLRKISVGGIIVALAAMLWHPFVEGIAIGLGVLFLIVLLITFGGFIF